VRRTTALIFRSSGIPNLNAREYLSFAAAKLLCRVRKLFRQAYINQASLPGMVKLNKKRIKWLVDQVVKHGKKPGEVCGTYAVSERRVQQLTQAYHRMKEYPALIKSRRPKTLLSSLQEQQISAAYASSQLTPRMLYYELKRYGQYAPKNKIYEYMKTKGLIKDEPNKKKKRKRCRYEWPSTGDMVHADYHRKDDASPHCIFWLDDHSRKILSGGEFESPNAENVLITFQQAEQALAAYRWVILRVNTDRGSVFVSNKDEGTSAFEQYCAAQGIQVIPSRIKNPQTNGKVERRWQEYNKHRHRFPTLQAWIEWHNNRLTTSLDIEHYETPNDAFLRGLPNHLALFFKEGL
jgi:putative transposase